MFPCRNGFKNDAFGNIAASDQLHDDVDRRIGKNLFRIGREKAGRKGKASVACHIEIRNPNDLDRHTDPAADQSAFSNRIFATPVPTVPNPMMPTPTREIMFPTPQASGLCGCLARLASCDVHFRQDRTAHTHLRLHRTRSRETQPLSPRGAGASKTPTTPETDREAEFWPRQTWWPRGLPTCHPMRLSPLTNTSRRF